MQPPGEPEEMIQESEEEMEENTDEEDELPSQQISLPMIEANCLGNVSKNADTKECVKLPLLLDFCLRCDLSPRVESR